MSQERETRMLCDYCGLPVEAGSRIAMLEMQIKALARAVLQLSRFTYPTGVTLDKVSDLEDIAYGVGRQSEPAKTRP